MIPVKEEPKEFYEEMRVYEHCFFCSDKTKYWNFPTNQPVCTKCAKKHDIEELRTSND